MPNLDTQSSLESVRLLRSRRLAKGLCIQCGLNPHTMGMQICESCRIKKRAAAKTLRDSRKESGKCPKCDRPRNGHLCDVHRIARREIDGKTRERLRSEKATAREDEVVLIAEHVSSDGASARLEARGNRYDVTVMVDGEQIFAFHSEDPTQAESVYFEATQSIG